MEFEHFVISNFINAYSRFLEHIFLRAGQFYFGGFVFFYTLPFQIKISYLLFFK